MTFEKSLNIVVGEEGDYSDDPKDAGGKTRFGITEKLARRYGYQGEMRDLPFSFASDVYRQEFWDALRLDDVDALDEAIATEMFDTSVNVGPGTGATWMQRVLNAFNKEQKVYPDVTVDGRIGTGTLGALTSYLRYRGHEGSAVFLKAYNCLQGAYYIGIAERNPLQEEFVYGWIRNRIELG